jgi:hypothetical protein
MGQNISGNADIASLHRAFCCRSLERDVAVTFGPQRDRSVTFGRPY